MEPILDGVSMFNSILICTCALSFVNVNKSLWMCIRCVPVNRNLKTVLFGIDFQSSLKGMHLSMFFDVPDMQLKSELLKLNI